MKTSIACAVSILAMATHAMAAVDVATSQKRAAALASGEKLLKSKSTEDSLANAINPFSLNGPRASDMPSQEDQAAARAAAMASNRTVLATLAERLEPKGVFVVGGEPIILLGQKKLKVGDKMPINFEGAVYELEIAAIETTRFTVKYQNEELTRPIVITKSGK